jgi:hypothetical protein
MYIVYRSRGSVARPSATTSLRRHCDGQDVRRTRSPLLSGHSSRLSTLTISEKRGVATAAELKRNQSDDAAQRSVPVLPRHVRERLITALDDIDAPTHVQRTDALFEVYSILLECTGDELQAACEYVLRRDPNVVPSACTPMIHLA